MKLLLLVGEHQVDIMVRPLGHISAPSLKEAKKQLIQQFTLREDGRDLVDNCGNRYRVIDLHFRGTIKKTT